MGVLVESLIFQHSLSLWVSDTPEPFPESGPSKSVQLPKGPEAGSLLAKQTRTHPDKMLPQVKVQLECANSGSESVPTRNSLGASRLDLWYAYDFPPKQDEAFQLLFCRELPSTHRFHFFKLLLCAYAYPDAEGGSLALDPRPELTGVGGYCSVNQHSQAGVGLKFFSIAPHSVFMALTSFFWGTGKGARRNMDVLQT